MTYARFREAEERDGFRFRGGNLALDLTATLAGRLKPCPVDRLGEPADLERWLVAAALSREPPNASDADLAMARELREVIYGLATARLSGAALPAGLAAKLNGVAARDAAVPQLNLDGEVTLVGSNASLLVVVARNAVELLGGPEADRLRQCEARTCTLLFVDRSRKHDRRWCSMAGCGNKAKVDSFRRRQREAANQ